MANQPVNIEVVITRGVRIAGKKHRPGEKLTLPANDAYIVLGVGKATKDLGWKPRVTKKPAESKK